VVSAWVLVRSERRKAIAYLTEALQSDVEDIQGGTTAEGVHIGAMAATVDLILRACTGIEVRDNALRFNPRLPHGLERLDLNIRFRGHVLDLCLTPDSFRVRSLSPGPAPFRLACGANEIDFPRGGEATFDLRRE
jgi:trehalose/maltose hydrolase-like predicted phosphorylase